MKTKGRDGRSRPVFNAEEMEPGQCVAGAIVKSWRREDTTEEGERHLMGYVDVDVVIDFTDGDQMLAVRRSKAGEAPAAPNPLAEVRVRLETLKSASAGRMEIWQEKLVSDPWGALMYAQDACHAMARSRAADRLLRCLRNRPSVTLQGVRDLAQEELLSSVASAATPGSSMMRQVMFTAELVAWKSMLEEVLV